MRVLGIDYGDVRVGIALADTTAPVAIPRPTILRDKKILGALSAIIAEEGVEHIVVGLPLRMAGGDSAMAKTVRSFANDIALRTKLPVSLVDERLSTHEAKKKGAKDVDAVAAAVILQAWLDQQQSSE